MSHSKGARERRPHRPSFAKIERILPGTGSDEARLLGHILRCEICTDAALAILQTGRRSSRRKPADYDAIFAAAAAAAAERFSWIAEQKTRSTALAEELLKIPADEARRQRARELAQVEPGSVTVSLLATANRLVRSDPNRPAQLAELAIVAAEAMSPKDHPPSFRAGLLAQAYFLHGESLYRSGRQEQAEEVLDQAEKQLAEATEEEPVSRYF